MLKTQQFSIFFLLFFQAFSPALTAQTVASNSSEFPNIVYILADDLGYGDISCYNENSRLQTHNVDQLAHEGLLFTDAHTSSAVCTPTRYGILTGRYNWRSKLKKGVLSGYSKALIEPERLTVGKLLQEKGYHTAFIGKWHLGWNWSFSGDAANRDNLNSRPEVDFSQPVENGPREQGFSYSYGFSGSLDMPPYVYVENNLPTSIPQDTTVNVDDKGFWRKGLTGSDFRHADVLPHLTHKAIQYIDQQASNNHPFFLYFALPAPHTPILPTTEFMGKSNTNFYGDFVLQVDNVVGQIVAALENNGIRGETLIVFTSDNGCSPKANFQELAAVGHEPSYIYRGHKADIYEGGHRVPFVVSWTARIREASRTDEIICTTDLMATAAEMVGTILPQNAGEDSYSFFPLLSQENYAQPLREATVHHSIDGRFAIRQGGWKLILWPGSGGWSFPRTPDELQGLPSMQLYNLEKDPFEKQNLVQDYPEKVEALKALLRKYIEEGRSTPGAPQKNDGPENWPELNWMTASAKDN
jgi:arylsulfatase A-like enzyme